MAYGGDWNNNPRRTALCSLTHAGSHTYTGFLRKLCLGWLVKLVSWSLSAPLSSIKGVTHFKLCKVDHVWAGLKRCLCSFSLYWNISSWLYSLQRTFWQWGSFRCSPECVAGAAEPADAKVESHQQSSTMFHTLALTGWPGGERESERESGGKKRKKEAQTTLELCESCVPSQFISQAKSSRLSCGKEGARHLSLSRPAHPAGEWQDINKARPPQPPATTSRSSQGLSFTHLISQGAGHRPGCPASC